VILSVEIDPNALESMKRLKHDTGASSYEALFNDAITLMGWAVKQRQGGRIVASLDEASNVYKELQMTSLEHAAEHAAEIANANASAA
jgi:hypothetical protein